MEGKIRINNRASSFDGINRLRIKYKKDGIISIHDIAPGWAGKWNNTDSPGKCRINFTGLPEKFSPVIGNYKPVGSNIRVIERMHKKYLKEGIEGLMPKYHNTFSNGGQEA